MADKMKAPEHAKGGNDKEAATRKSSSVLPSVSVPKGVGAIRGIGEKFGKSNYRNRFPYHSDLLKQP
jgi:hypothetical protein